jgi:hypothetical protein
VVDVAGVKIGLFGLIRALPEDADRWKVWRLDARDPIAAARDEVVALRARGARVVIALVHAGPYEEAKKILQAAPGIDWAVLGHSALNLETPDDVIASGEGGSPAAAHRGRFGTPLRVPRKMLRGPRCSSCAAFPPMAPSCLPVSSIYCSFWSGPRAWPVGSS